MSIDEDAFQIMVKRAGIKPDNLPIMRKFIGEYEAAKSEQSVSVSLADMHEKFVAAYSDTCVIVDAELADAEYAGVKAVLDAAGVKYGE